MKSRSLRLESLETRELLAITVDIDLNDLFRKENAGDVQQEEDYHLDNVLGHTNSDNDFIPILLHHTGLPPAPGNIRDDFQLEHAQMVESKMVEHINSIYTLRELNGEGGFDTEKLITAAIDPPMSTETVRFVRWLLEGVQPMGTSNPVNGEFFQGKGVDIGNERNVEQQPPASALVSIQAVVEMYFSNHPNVTVAQAIEGLAYGFANIAAHELGHSLGLQHMDGVYSPVGTPEHSLMSTPEIGPDRTLEIKTRFSQTRILNALERVRLKFNNGIFPTEEALAPIAYGNLTNNLVAPQFSDPASAKAFKGFRVTDITLTNNETAFVYLDLEKGDRVWLNASSMDDVNSYDQWTQSPGPGQRKVELSIEFNGEVVQQPNDETPHPNPTKGIISDDPFINGYRVQETGRYKVIVKKQASEPNGTFGVEIFGMIGPEVMVRLRRWSPTPNANDDQNTIGDESTSFQIDYDIDGENATPFDLHFYSISPNSISSIHTLSITSPADLTLGSHSVPIDTDFASSEAQRLFVTTELVADGDFESLAESAIELESGWFRVDVQGTSFDKSFYYGTDGADAVFLADNVGNYRDVQILAFGGNDVVASTAAATDLKIYAGDGDDLINAGPGNDTIYGGFGNDEIYAEDGQDDVYSGGIIYRWDQQIEDDDEVYGGNGSDFISGGFGNDYLDGGPDFITDYDYLWGNTGNDTFVDGFFAAGGLGSDDLSDCYGYCHDNNNGSPSDFGIHGAAYLYFGPMDQPWVDDRAVDYLSHAVYEVQAGFEDILDVEPWTNIYYRQNEQPAGDLYGDQNIDVWDIDLLFLAIAISETTNDDFGSAFDLNGDGSLNVDDMNTLIFDILQTVYGDVNLDGTFDDDDLVAAMIYGEYEDSLFLNSSWATGDWDGDFEFTSSDLVLAFAGTGL